MRRADADEPSPAAAGKAAIEVIEYPAAKAPAAPAGAGAKNSCPVAQESPVIVRIPRASLNAEGFQALNTLGYNYRQPDDPPDRFVPSAARPGIPQPQP